MKKSIRILLAALLAVMTGLFFAGCGSSDASAADQTDSKAAAEQEAEFDIAAAEDSPEFVGKLKQAKNADQLFVVAAIGKTTAYVSMHQKDKNGKWKQILTTPGYIGKEGLGKTKEGDNKTPVGTYHFNYAFGINDDPGCKAFKYQKVTDNDYWSGDQKKGHKYNQMVSIKDIKDLDTENSEHIVEYPVHYQYCLNISWNEEGKAGKGSAIFLHCLGPQKPYTGGCVALPKDQVIKAIKNVDKDCVVVIDSLQKISPELWKEWGL